MTLICYTVSASDELHIRPRAHSARSDLVQVRQSIELSPDAHERIPGKDNKIVQGESGWERGAHFM